MAKKNRETLKSYFENGAMPTESNFVDLIDSALNLNDDGFERSVKHGIHISTQAAEDVLMSFFRSNESHKAQWTIELHENDSLIIRRNHEHSLLTESEPYSESETSTPENDEIFTMTSNGKIGINEPIPQADFHVNGTFACSGREGVEGEKDVPADGKWHTILENMTGCNALEIMAGVGKKGTGKYALMHAFAINAFHDKKKIKYHQAYYRRRANKIKLRWIGSTFDYKLQMKTLSDYKEGIVIRYNLTKLWSDPLMEKCLKE